VIGMDIIQIVGIGIIATVLAVIVKEQKPELALGISIATGILIFLLVIGNLTSIMDLLDQIAGRAHLNNVYFITILKVLGIAYIAEFGAQISKDAGEGAIASKIELGGKILIMVLSIPILASLFDLVFNIIS